MGRLLVFIPGMMGSKLKGPAAAGGTPVWHEGMVSALTQVAKNPAILKLPGGKLEADGVLHWVNHPLNPFGKIRICEELRRALTDMALIGNQFSFGEFSYDWRQDIISSARALGEYLDSHGFKRNAEGLQEKEESPRLALVCHSMGGVVAAVALKKGYINPANVYRYVNIGTPLLGAPTAFRGLYDTGYLPGMDWLEFAINFRWNRATCRRILLESFQSFISSYQLLPAVGEDFVELDGNGTTNPLSGPIVPGDKRNAAQAVHSLLNNIEAFLKTFPSLQYLLIFGDHPNNTTYRLKASVNRTSSQYENVRDRNRINGDGTVPAGSASINDRGSGRAAVPGAAHMKMCDDSRVLRLVKDFLAP